RLWPGGLLGRFLFDVLGGPFLVGFRIFAPLDLFQVAMDGLADQPVGRAIGTLGGGFEPCAGGVVEFHAKGAAHALPSEPCLPEPRRLPASGPAAYPV